MLTNGIIDIGNCKNNPGMWTGYTDTDWNKPSNWCSNTVPTSTTDVIIVPGNHQPVIDSVVSPINSIMIDAGATVTIITTDSLTVNTTFDNSGSFYLNAGILRVTGAWTNEASGSFLATTGALKVSSIFINKRSFYCRYRYGYF
jgi:hypothetical protein